MALIGVDLVQDLYHAAVVPVTGIPWIRRDIGFELG